MKLLTNLCLVFFLSFFTASCEDDGPVTFITGDQIDAVVEDEMALQNIIGIVVGVVQDGQIIHTKAYGHTDQLRTRPITTSSVIRWASISKTMTAVAAFRAITDGHMALEDMVTQHNSHWPTSSSKGDITIKHLLTHRSGIVQYGNDEDGNEICDYNASAYTANNNWNANQSVDMFKNCDLAFSPNANYLYSTFGFNLLGATIEKAVDMPYEAYVDEKIADVANMPSLTPYSNDLGGFRMDCNRYIYNSEEGDTEYKLPGGGWASNIVDLTRFMQGIINNSFLTSSIVLWFQSIPGNEESGYRYGVFTETLGNKLYVNHGGDNASVETYIGFFPDDKDGVAFMTTSSSYPNKSRLGKKILNLMGYDWPVDDYPIDECGNVNNCGDTMTAVWRDNGEADNTLIRRGLGHNRFHEEWRALSDLGYYLEDIETYLDGGNRKWDGIFKRKTGKDTALYRDVTDWAGNHQEVIADGFRLMDIETYVDNGTRYWAGTYIESGDKAAVSRNLTTSEFGDRYAELNEDDYRLIDVEAYKIDGELRWAGVWRDSGYNQLNRNYNTQDFIDLRTNRRDDGWKLIDVETYLVDGERKWAGVWEEAPDSEIFHSEKKMCNLINNFHDGYKKDGKEILDLGRY